MDEAPQPWFAVRSLVRFEPATGPVYEERITLWRASSFEEAVERAESEAREYACDVDGECVDFTQAFHLTVEAEVMDGTEVFSLMRNSLLMPDNYISRFFDTGEEHQGRVD